MKLYMPHVIYILIIVTLVFFLCKKPKEVIRTVIKSVDKIVVQNQVKYIDRVVTTKKHNGDVTIITEHSGEDSFVASRAEVRDTTFSKVTNYSSSYLFSTYYPVTIIPFNPLNLQVTVGMRLASLPVFLDIGTDLKFNKILMGITFEL